MTIFLKLPQYGRYKKIERGKALACARQQHMSPKPITPINQPRPEDLFRSSTLLRIPMIKNAAVMAYALKLNKDYFTAYPALNWASPPLPADMASFIPCTLLVTDRSNIATGEIIGRIRFLQDVDGYDTEATYFDEEWIITPAST